MTKRVVAASYQRSIDLIDAGCPLDYPMRRKPLHVEQLAGYAESRVYSLGSERTGYVIGLHVRTDASAGTIITEWSVVPSWGDHLVSWDYAPEDIIPKGDWPAYESIVDSRLMAVLNEGHLLRRGYPIDGLLCGCSPQPIPESSDGRVSARLTLVDDAGDTVALRIRLAVFGSAAKRSNALPRRAGRLFDRRDEHTLRTGGTL